jgi:uncharacterized protein (TIGR02001 family)
MAWRAVFVEVLLCEVLVARPAVAASDGDADRLQVKIDIALTSDYIYRGVSLSERKPSVISSVEVQRYGFYGSVHFASVDLPNNPAAELTLAGGYRWTFCNVEFDAGANYFYYPGQLLTGTAANLNYWEYDLEATRTFEGLAGKYRDIELKGTVAYSPDVSGTGAWGAYAEGQLTYDLPKLNLWKLIDWHLIASAGYWRFGNTSSAQGGFALPSYANWRVGLAFELNDHINLDFSYYDTNLSREDCFVFTGDTMATLGGVPNPLSNPDGLRSRLCGASFVATLSGTFELSDLKRR